MSRMSRPITAAAVMAAMLVVSACAAADVDTAGEEIAPAPVEDTAETVETDPAADAAGDTADDEHPTGEGATDQAEGLVRIPFEGEVVAGWTTTDEITPEMTTFTALVGGPACAAAGDEPTRDATPQVSVTPDAIVVTVLVDLGDADRVCVDIEPTPVEIDLGEPLGNRELVDGGDLEERRRSGASEPVTDDGGEPDPQS